MWKNSQDLQDTQDFQNILKTQNIIEVKKDPLKWTPKRTSKRTPEKELKNPKKSSNRTLKRGDLD